LESADRSCLDTDAGGVAALAGRRPCGAELSSGIELEFGKSAAVIAVAAAVGISVAAIEIGAVAGGDIGEVAGTAVAVPSTACTPGADPLIEAVVSIGLDAGCGPATGTAEAAIRFGWLAFS
jgi:hypothetical protein